MAKQAQKGQIHMQKFKSAFSDPKPSNHNALIHKIHRSQP